MTDEKSNGKIPDVERGFLDAAIRQIADWFGQPPQFVAAWLNQARHERPETWFLEIAEAFVYCLRARDPATNHNKPITAWLVFCDLVTARVDGATICDWLRLPQGGTQPAAPENKPARHMSETEKTLRAERAELLREQDELDRHLLTPDGAARRAELLPRLKSIYQRIRETTSDLEEARRAP